MLEASPTTAIAKLACDYEFDALPADVVQMAKLALLDNLGCAVRGAIEPLTRILGKELFGIDTTGNHFVPGALVKARPSDIAMLHAASAHAIDYDDSHPEATAHLGSPVIGAVSALAPYLGASGKTIIAAIVAGYETGTRITRLLSGDHYMKGFHCTGTVGVFAAATASAKLIGMDVDRTRMVLGLAATQAAGIKATFGTMAKPYNAAHAAACGVLAARLVGRGFTAPTSALEDDKGYLQMYMGLPAEQWAVKRADDYSILGNQFKFHAACHATHAMISAIRALKAEQHFRADDCAEVIVETAGICLKTASVINPVCGLECKFSFPQVAAYALGGMDTAAEDTYSNESIDNPTLLALRKRVKLVENNEFPPQLTRVVIKLSNGDSFSARFDLRYDLGSIDDTTVQLEEKFIANTAAYVGIDGAEKLKNVIMSMEQHESIANTFDPSSWPPSPLPNPSLQCP